MSDTRPRQYGAKPAGAPPWWPKRGPPPTTPEEARLAEATIAAATPLQLMIAETQRRLGRQGWDVEASAPKIDEWFPEASAADKSMAVEVGAACALLELRR